MAKTLLIVVLALILPSTVNGEIILAQSYDGMNHLPNGSLVGYDIIRSHSLAVQATIVGSGSYLATSVVAPISGNEPPRADPRKFSLYLRRDDENFPGERLTSVQLDAQIYGFDESSSARKFAFDQPIVVKGGESYWITLEPNDVLPMPLAIYEFYGVSWGSVVDAEPSDSRHYASRNGEFGKIPDGQWLVSQTITTNHAFQLLGVPEPRSLWLVGSGVAALTTGSLRRNQKSERKRLIAVGQPS